MIEVSGKLAYNEESAPNFPNKVKYVSFPVFRFNGTKHVLVVSNLFFQEIFKYRLNIFYWISLIENIFNSIRSEFFDFCCFHFLLCIEYFYCGFLIYHKLYKIIEI